MTTAEALTTIIAVAAAVTAVVAAFYTAAQSFATKEQADIARQALREQVQPYVIADVRKSERQASCLDLIVENVGRSVARNVQVVFDPPLRSVAFDRTDYNAPIAHISAIPPGHRLTWQFDIGFRLFEKGADTPRKYSVRITADGPFGRVDPTTYDIDLNVIEQHEDLDPGSLKGIEKALKQSNGQLANMTSAAREIANLLKQAEGEAGSTTE